MLNTAKGPAVRALRAQADKFYTSGRCAAPWKIRQICIYSDMVERILVRGGRVTGVVTRTGAEYAAQAISFNIGNIFVRADYYRSTAPSRRSQRATGQYAAFRLF